jgi:hypothetical protein
MINRLLIGGVVAIVALSVVAYAFASGGDGGGSNGNPGDDLAQVEPTPNGGAPVDLPATTPANANETPTTSGGNAAGGTRPAGSNEPFGPAGEPITKTPDAPVSNSPGPAPDAVRPTPVPPAPPTTPAGQAPSLPADRHPEPAPIDGLDIRVAESFPPQYFLNIKAGLPSGCAQQYMHSVSRSGDVITVEVLNSMPRNTICTAIYGMYELNINLGSSFDSGKTYTIKVNDETTTFIAQ